MGITLKDVAKFSGVSVATASQALNNKPVGKESKRRVFRAAKMLRYEPSALARGLRTNRTYTLGLATENPKMEFLNAVVHKAQERGYNVIYQPYSEYDRQAELSAYQSLMARRVDGVLIWPSKSAMDYGPIIEDFRHRNIEVVIVDQPLSGVKVPTFCFDNRRGTKMAWLHLWKLGYKPIVYIDFKESFSSVVARREGIRDAHLEVGIRWNENFHFKVLEYDTLDKDLLRRAMETARSGGAILTAADHIAFSILRLNQEEMGIDIPGQMALIGFEDVALWLNERIGWITSPPLSTIRMSFDQVGAKATEFLLDFLDKKAKASDSIIENKTCLIEPQLVVRKSCGGEPGIYGLDEKDKMYFRAKEDF